MVEKLCKVPLCENSAFPEWETCAMCMRNTVRRFLKSEGNALSETPSQADLDRAHYWIGYVNANIDSLVEDEKRRLRLYGPEYDRDESHPPIHLVYEN